MVIAVYHMNYLQAIIIGLIQGLTELVPISSLGHTVLVPSWIGGSWATLVHQEASSKSPYLSFVVGLHLATAVALIGFYFREWVRLIGGFFRSIIRFKIETDVERLAWLIVLATIPVGALGLIFEHQFRVLFAKPVAAGAFLAANGLIMLFGEYHRRRASTLALNEMADSGVSPAEVGSEFSASDLAAAQRRSRSAKFRDESIVPMNDEAESKLSRMGVKTSILIGVSESLALLAGISREGVAMVGGLLRGLDHEDAMRFSFLLSTPVILAAGALKIPDLTGKLGAGIHGQIFAGSAAALLTSLIAILFLSKYFKTRTLAPFAWYSIAFGLVSVVRFAAF